MSEKQKPVYPEPGAPNPYFTQKEYAGVKPVEVEVVQPASETAEASQLLSQYTGFTEGLMDAALNGQNVEGTLIGYVQTMLEQNAGRMSREDVNRLADKRLELIRRRNMEATPQEPVVMPQSEPESSKTISPEELKRLRDQG